MRQGNGTELLGMNDSRSATIGIIYVSPNDDRKSVLAAILTQEKLSRKQVLIDLPNPNKAFSRPQDFDDLKSIRKKLQTRLIFVSPGTDGPAEFARQRGFDVFPSLESYKQSLTAEQKAETNNVDKSGKRGRIFGSKSRASIAEEAGVAALGGMAGAEAARAISPREQKTPPFNTHSSTPTPLRQIDDDDALDDTSASATNTGIAKKSKPIQQTPIAHTPGDHDYEFDEDEGTHLAQLPSKQPELPNTPPSAKKGSNKAGVGAAMGAATNQSTNKKPSGAMGSTPTPQDNADDTAGIINLEAPRKPNRPVRSINHLNEPLLTEQFNPPQQNTRRKSGNMAAAGGALAGGALVASNTGKTPGMATTAVGGKGSTRPLPTGAAAQRGGAGATTGRRPATSRRRPPMGRILLLLLLLLLLTALIAGTVFASLDPTQFRSMIVQPLSNLIPGAGGTATITIIPDNKLLQDSYVIKTVEGTPRADQLEVGQRTLNATPQPQTKQVDGTGKTQTQTTPATGTLTFKNGSSSSFTISSSIPIPAPNGVEVLPNTSVTVPGADFNTGQIGVATVRAHTIEGGARANIPAGAINRQCCTVGNYINVTNGTFTGGQDPQNYTFVKQSDVDNAAQPLKENLSNQAMTSFKNALKPNEQLVSSPDCTVNVKVNPTTVGDKGRNILSTQLSVSSSCTGLAYDHDEVQKIATYRLQKKADTDPGSGYGLTGNIVTTIEQANKQKQGASLLVNASGRWVFQVNDTIKHDWAKLIAGKKISTAETLLKTQKGVGSFKVEANGHDTFPDDPNQIDMNIQSVPGAPTPTSTPDMTIQTPTPANVKNGNG